MNALYPIDRFGFTEYAVVLHAEETQLTAVAAFRREIGLLRAMYEAHVTVKGTFTGISDLNAVRVAVASIASQVSPFAVEFAALPHEVIENGLLVPVQHSALLEEVRSRLEETLAPISKDAYGQAPFQPHLTLCFACTSEQMAKAHKLAASVLLGSGFTATSLDLMARTGDPFHGGYCTVIDCCSLRGVNGGRVDALRALYRNSASAVR